MDNAELARVRQARLAQLQAAGRPGANQDEKQTQEKKERDAEMRNTMLSALLTQEARARLATLGTAKPDRARMVEDIIIQNARGMGGKVDENSLKDLLEKVNAQMKRETKVKYERRRVFDDDDDDDDDQ